ncbi:hypothetical protein BH11PLA1_BH11PLA1_01400 [soil metagenome]
MNTESESLVQDTADGQPVARAVHADSRAAGLRRSGETGAPASWRDRPGRLLARLRIRKKLMVLHTLFSLVLAIVLLLVLRPVLERIVEQAEVSELRLALGMASEQLQLAAQDSAVGGTGTRIGARRGFPPGSDLFAPLRAAVSASGGTLEIEPATTGELDADALARARATPREPTLFTRVDPRGALQHAALLLNPGAEGPRGAGAPPAFVATLRLDHLRASLTRLYLVALVALLAVYALIAVALEVFVLPQHVYRPIRTLLNADAAVQQGRSDGEIIPEAAIPADELGEIMRSRNDAVRALRRHEADLALALRRVETLATDLHRKNALLETAQRNLADADRLASLGILSAGLAHEMNTPLAVAKGLAEKAAAPGAGLNAGETALLVRVVSRLERLSESLLDFARVRPPSAQRVDLLPIVDEAWTLVRLDRDAGGVALNADIPGGFALVCDPDRMTQVLVNLLRNAVDLMTSMRAQQPRIALRARTVERDGMTCAEISIADNGPGLAPDILPRLFEPFATTRMDARGTGLGLAVSAGIVKEHGGVLSARNLAAGDDQALAELLTGGVGAAPRARAANDARAALPLTGAVFEIIIPVPVAPAPGVATVVPSLMP